MRDESPAKEKLEPDKVKRNKIKTALFFVKESISPPARKTLANEEGPGKFQALLFNYFSKSR
jgi:hypothetical protein